MMDFFCCGCTKQDLANEKKNQVTLVPEYSVKVAYPKASLKILSI